MDFDELLRRVDVRGPDECWEWQGRRHSHGYGLLGRAYVHRLVYELATGESPRGWVVRHHCDNPPCVNPAHLAIGTPADNSRDMASRERGSHRRGLDVAEVLALHDAGVRTGRIAELLGCTYEPIKRILRRNGRSLFGVGRPHRQFCKLGHPMAGANLMVIGQRREYRCRLCASIAGKARWAARKAREG